MALSCWDGTGGPLWSEVDVFYALKGDWNGFPPSCLLKSVKSVCITAIPSLAQGKGRVTWRTSPSLSRSDGGIISGIDKERFKVHNRRVLGVEEERCRRSWLQERGIGVGDAWLRTTKDRICRFSSEAVIPKFATQRNLIKKVDTQLNGNFPLIKSGGFGLPQILCFVLLTFFFSPPGGFLASKRTAF